MKCDHVMLNTNFWSTNFTQLRGVDKKKKWLEEKKCRKMNDYNEIV